MNKIVTTIAIEPDQKALLELLARRFQRSQNNLIREAIELLRDKYIKGKKKEEQSQNEEPDKGLES